MTTPIYIYGHGFVAAESHVHTKKRADDGAHVGRTVRRTYTRLASCSFDNRARLPSASTSSCINETGAIKIIVII